MAYSDNDLLSIGEYYTKDHKKELIEPTNEEYHNSRPKPSPESMMKARNLTMLNDLNNELERNLDPNYKFDFFKNQKELDNLIDSDGKVLFFDLDEDIYDIHTRMLNCRQLTDNVDDPKFKEYLRLRKNLNKIINRMYATNQYNTKSYSINSIHAIIKKLDSYLIPYLNMITIAGSASNSINYLKYTKNKSKLKEPINKSFKKRT
jgi:hypothetical protein